MLRPETTLFDTAVARLQKAGGKKLFVAHISICSIKEFVRLKERKKSCNSCKYMNQCFDYVLKFGL